jgi:hypothetical protein
LRKLGRNAVLPVDAERQLRQRYVVFLAGHFMTVARKGSPLRKLGRNVVLPVNAERQLRRRIVRLQEVGFGLTLNYIRMFAVQVCKEHGMQNPRNGRMVGKGCFLSENEPRLNYEESRTSQLWPPHCDYQSKSAWFPPTLWQKNGRYEGASAATYNVDEAGLQLRILVIRSSWL